MIQFEKRSSGTNAIVGVIFLVAVLFLLFWLAKSIFTILAWIAPALLIAAVIIDYQSVLGYGKWLLHNLRHRTLNGIIYTLLTIVGFPVVSFFLFGKALLKKKMKTLEKAHEQKREGIYTEYEIMEENTPTLELPPLKKQKKQADNDYEQLFD